MEAGRFSFVLFVAVLASLSTAQAQCVTTYTVRQGESLFTIAPRFGLTWQEIWLINQQDIPDYTVIYPGQKIRIPSCDGGGPSGMDESPAPVPSPGPSPGAEGGCDYTVLPGDSLFSIAFKFGLSWETLWLANQKKVPDYTRIYPGQELRIPNCDGGMDVPSSPLPSPGSSTGNGGGNCDFEGEYGSGEATFYYPSGATACGEYFNDKDYIAAVSWRVFDDSTGNPNTSPTCKMCIEVCGPAGRAVVEAKDKCGACKEGDIDLTPVVFKEVVGDLGIGRQPGVVWRYVQC